MPDERKLPISSSERETFEQDAALIAGLTSEQRDAILQLFSSRAPTLKAIDEDELEQLRRESLTEKDLEGVYRFIRFVLPAVTRKQLTIDEVDGDLGQIASLTSEARDSVIRYLRTFATDCPQFAIAALKREFSRDTVPTIRSIGFSTDARAVFDEEQKLLGFVPVLLARLRVEGLRKEEEFVFQMDADTADKLCELLVEERTKLGKLAETLNALEENHNG